MRKVFAAIAVAMMSIFLVGCSVEIEPDPSLVNSLMGRWVLSYMDDEPAPTNSKIVYNFVSATEAYVSASFDANPTLGTIWADFQEASVAIRSDIITLTYHPSLNSTVIHEIAVRSITGSELTAYAAVTVITDGIVVFADEGPVRLRRVPVDYSAAVLGLWEGQMVSEESAYDDGQDSMTRRQRVS